MNLKYLWYFIFIFFFQVYVIPTYATDFSNKITNDLLLFNAVKHNFFCQIGKEQSPINIQSFKTSIITPDLQTYYTHDFFYEMNTSNGVKIATHLNSMQYIELSGKIYHLINFFIDTPSNTEINNQTFPAEINFFHLDEDGHMVMLAVFVQEGDFNTAIQELIVHFPKYKFYFKKIYMNLTRLLPRIITDYYLYNGSLLNPPCTEGVKWVIFTHPIYASAKQINRLKKISNLKIRPVQLLGLRIVKHASYDK